MSRRSAGILLWRRAPAGPEVLLGHPGGPLFARKDDGVWSIPKGEYGDDEQPLAAAYREFAEEVGVAPPDGDPLPLGETRLRSGKLVTAWALEGDLDVGALVSNLFSMQWPPGSGRFQEFPELDRAAWFDVVTARQKIGPGQVPLLDRFAELVQ
ncbi:MAG TPA: NUDIX domain-containing protein [Mycobacteriales bacterium]|nr:NUDIX domain-containing protein [Mycobacteriales bacterium]